MEKNLLQNTCFWSTSTLLIFLPFILKNNQLNSMASDFFREKIIHGVDSKYPFCVLHIYFCHKPSTIENSWMYSVFFSMVNKTEEIIHSVFLFHKPYQLHMNTTSSFISTLKHFCFIAQSKTEQLTQSHIQFELPFTRHTHTTANKKS